MSSRRRNPVTAKLDAPDPRSIAHATATPSSGARRTKATVAWCSSHLQGLRCSRASAKADKPQTLLALQAAIPRHAQPRAALRALHHPIAGARTLASGAARHWRLNLAGEDEARSTRAGSRPDIADLSQAWSVPGSRTHFEVVGPRTRRAQVEGGERISLQVLEPLNSAIGPADPRRIWNRRRSREARRARARLGQSRRTRWSS